MKGSTDDFDLKALHAALDAERQVRGLTWAQATREIGAVGSVTRRPVASSTITSLRTKALAEADGVLQMLRWLGRAPESFVTGVPADLAAAALPRTNRPAVLRFDTRKLYDAISRAREASGMTWTEMSAATGVPVSHMRGLARGGRTAFPFVTRLTRWLREPASSFVRLSQY